MEKTQKKETKQNTLDLKEYIATLEQQLDKGFIGTVTEINPCTNEVYFKGAGNFDTRDGIAVVVIVDDPSQTEFSNWFGLPNVRGYEKSNLYAFKHKYGSVPKVDMKVEVIIDDNGFFKIKY